LCRDVHDPRQPLSAAVLDQLPLRPAMHIAEIGCGSGDLTLPLAARLPRGQVHAVDSVPAMLAVVRERARAAGHTNIATHLVAPGEVPLPLGGFDGVLLTLMLHALPAAVRAGYLARLRALIRPGGWLALLEWERRRTPGAGPPLAARVTPREACTVLAAGGWQAVVLTAPDEGRYLVIAGQCRRGDAASL
jgi:ubiquinone/menaquinone biosynthesis C-methylase UbiE